MAHIMSDNAPSAGGDGAFTGTTGYRRRWIEPRLTELLATFEVVVLTGARQVGKTTLLRNLDLPGRWAYVTMDDLDARAQAQEDPRSLWQGLDGLIVDEVQKEPALLSQVKLAVDRARERVLRGEAERVVPRFILSGSANLLLMQGVTESLVGRAGYLALRPFTLGEALGGSQAPAFLEEWLAGRLPDAAETDAPPPSEVSGVVVPPDVSALIARGLMPALQVQPAISSSDWWEGYVRTYLERDLRQLTAVSSLVGFRRMMQALARRTGRLLNLADLARDADLPHATVGRWLNLLETGYLAFRLPAYASARGSRLLKMPKAEWLDPALPAYLAGLTDGASVERAQEAGGLFEGLVHHHLAALADCLRPAGRLCHWRTVAGREVDLVLEWGGSLVAVEVKSSETVGFRDTDGLRAFMDSYPECAAGIVVYRGSEVRRLGAKLAAVPWWVVAGA
jgi:predicted AAA+ superfamily ATPase